MALVVILPPPPHSFWENSMRWGLWWLMNYPFIAFLTFRTRHWSCGSYVLTNKCTCLSGAATVFWVFFLLQPKETRAQRKYGLHYITFLDSVPFFFCKRDGKRDRFISEFAVYVHIWSICGNPIFSHAQQNGLAEEQIWLHGDAKAGSSAVFQKGRQTKDACILFTHLNWYAFWSKTAYVAVTLAVEGSLCAVAGLLSQPLTFFNEPFSCPAHTLYPVSYQHSQLLGGCVALHMHLTCKLIKHPESWKTARVRWFFKGNKSSARITFACIPY